MRAVQTEDKLQVCCRDPTGYYEFMAVDTPWCLVYPELEDWYYSLTIVPPSMEFIQISKYGTYKMRIATKHMLEVACDFPSREEDA